MRKLLSSIGSKLKGGEGSEKVSDFPEDLRHVHLIDTSVASDNVGDEVIVEAAHQHIAPLFDDAYVSSSAGHDGLGPSSRALVERADYVLMMGTNALSDRYRVGKNFVWRMEEQDIAVLTNKVVLLGVGANRRFEAVEPKQRQLLNQILSDRHTHSVRDDLAARIVTEAGHKAVNTSCPTLWRWAKEQPDCPASPADTVCFTLTKHKADPADSTMVSILRKVFSNLWFWPQQPRDLGYLREITSDEGIQVLPPNLGAYDRFLRETETDVVGTRLHGGIRAIQHGRRTVIVAIDNRAEEMGANTRLFLDSSQR